MKLYEIIGMPDPTRPDLTIKSFILDFCYGCFGPSGSVHRLRLEISCRMVGSRAQTDDSGPISLKFTRSPT